MPRVSYNEEQKIKFLEEIASFFKRETLSKKDIDNYASKRKLPVPYFIYHDDARKVAHGKYTVALSGFAKLPPFPKFEAKKAARSAPVVVPEVVEEVVPVATPEATPVSVTVREVLSQMPASIQADTSCTVPEVDPTFIPFGNYDDIETIIASKMFFPVYITGMSGNGKTMSIVQACAKLGREILRINVTEETDELDLLGGTELINGSTVNREGAVLLAMRRGAILLIDEGDLNNTKIMCLMPILEGKPYFNKKTGEVIAPAPGFNVFFTGNTKGKGSDDGRYVGTKVMNEAFLERLAITMEQEYPDPKVEKRIVLRNMEQQNCVDDDFATKLCTFAEITRKTYAEQAISEIISTRRLTHIVKAFSVFKDRMKALTLALNRFDAETKGAFLDVYSKIDGTVNITGSTETEPETALEAPSAPVAAPVTQSSPPLAMPQSNITSDDKTSITNLIQNHKIEPATLGSTSGSSDEYKVYSDMITRVLSGTSGTVAADIGITNMYDGTIRVYGNKKEVRYPKANILAHDSVWKATFFLTVCQVLLNIKTVAQPF